MADGVNYDVNAWLRTKGSFGREVSSAASAADTFGKRYESMAGKFMSAGRKIRGSFGLIAADLGKAALLVGGAGLAGALAAATKQGVTFNDTMEQGALGLATMYQTFGVSEGLESNLKLARAMQSELIKIADASPGTNEDIFTAYQAMSPGVSGVTQDLERQRDLMSKMAVMSWTTAGDYKQMGADVGRIVRGLAGADVQVFSVLQPAIEKAFTSVTGKQVAGDFAQQFNKLAKKDGDKALRIFEKALETIGPEFNEAFGQSFSGILATTESRLKALGGVFGKPIFDAGKKALNKLNTEGVLRDGKAWEGLQTAALFAGDLLAQGVERSMDMANRAAVWVSEHWVEAATMLRDAGLVAGAAIKSALVIGGARLAAGTAVSMVGRLIAGGGALMAAAQPVVGWMRKRMAKDAGLKGKAARTASISKLAAGGLARPARAAKAAGGFAGKAGGALAESTGFAAFVGMMRTKFRSLGKDLSKNKYIDAFVRTTKNDLAKLGGMWSRVAPKREAVGRFASAGLMFGSLATVAGIAGIALGGVMVAIGGVAAYFVSNWQRISGAIVQGLEDGSITLVPLITSLYTFYLRLQLVGEALLGGSSATDMISGGLNLMTGAVDMASATLSWFIKGLSIMVGAWGTLKLGMLGILAIIEQIVRLGVKLRVVDKSVLDRGRANIDEYARGVQDTFTRADELARAADAIAEAKLSPLDVKKAEAKAKELQNKLSDALSGKNKGKDGRPAKPAVKIGKVVVEMDMRDPDPDRLMAGFIPRLEAMADKRVQPYDAID